MEAWCAVPHMVRGMHSCTRCKLDVQVACCRCTVQRSGTVAAITPLRCQAKFCPKAWHQQRCRQRQFPHSLPALLQCPALPSPPSPPAAPAGCWAARHVPAQPAVPAGGPGRRSPPQTGQTCLQHAVEEGSGEPWPVAGQMQRSPRLRLFPPKRSAGALPASNLSTQPSTPPNLR